MSGLGDIPEDPDNLRLEKAGELFLEAKALDVSEKTVRDYRDRLRWFFTWCGEQGIETVDDLSGLVFDRARAARAQTAAPTTTKGTMVAVNQLVKYLARIEIVPTDLAEKVDVPSVDTADQTSDTVLAPDDATSLLDHYRDDTGLRGNEQHTLLEIAWNTGARIGGIRSLDLSDYERLDDDGGGLLEFSHRPDSDTPLKNKSDGERVVRVPDTVCDVIDFYVERDRVDCRDDHGRTPLLTCRQGRPSITTLRSWSYLVTQPCVYQQCPHDERRETCEYRKRNHASKCPSSRSPHQIRSGSITWQLNRGIPLEVVSERVNASPEVVSQFYDKASERQAAERRAKYTSDLDIDNPES